MNNTTILVVDDEPQIRRVLRATLSSYGYDAVEAKDGQEAIEMVIRERPALILMDVNMPGMNGLEACRKIRLSFDGPIIMVTVRNSERDKVLALDAGADDYVVKPITMGELLARIRAVLRRTASEEPLPKIDTRELSVDLEKREVEVCGERVHLSPKCGSGANTHRTKSRQRISSNWRGMRALPNRSFAAEFLRWPQLRSKL